MFHTFQTSAAATGQAHSRNHPKTRRQSSTTQACEECRRRKIRCDGKKPCSHCEWYKHPKLCRYVKKQPRVVPSQKLLEELSTALRQNQKVIAQLFPNADIKDLGSMPRAELVELILNLSASQLPSSRHTSPAENSELGDSCYERGHSEDAPLQALEEEPAADGALDETQTNTNGVPAIPDDVNALSMSVHRQSSYVGISSVAAALRVISKITTAMESVITANPPKSAALAHGGASPSRQQGDNNDEQYEPSLAAMTSGQNPAIRVPVLGEPTLVDAYFYHVHPMIPMIDEVRFRANLAADDRKDAAWLALLNTICAMGTIAASTADDNSHLYYFQQAKQYLDLDMLGSGSIEVVQALGILGGYYLHYESKPNMASAIMGAAMRMACALGLHREYAENTSKDDDSLPRNTLLIPREVRRRTWWSLFCLDTWASTTTGRPSLGRISNGVNVALPTAKVDKIANLGSETTADDVYVMLICQETAFCKIATRVQDRLAESPLLPFEETARLDLELKTWYNNLPPILRWPEPCVETAKTPRAVLSWRYHNLRIVLHRPMLLNNALRSSLERPEPPSEEELRSVANCRRIAGEAIEDIRNQWEATQIAGWNAVWLLFQAAMVPLVTLFAEYNRGNFEAVRDAQVHVQSALDQLEIMQDWSITAKRSHDVVSRIFARNKLLVSHAREVMELQRKQAKEQLRKRHQERREKEREQYQQQRRQSQSQSPVLQASTPQQHHAARQPSPPQQGFSSHPAGMNFLSSYEQSSQMIAAQNMANAHSSHPLGSASPPSTTSFDNNQVAYFPEGLMPPPQQSNLVDTMGMGLGANGNASMADGFNYGTNYIKEDELNAFWDQIMWGDADANAFIMDTSVEALPPWGQDVSQESSFRFC